jgi:hypothetical protein
MTELLCGNGYRDILMRLWSLVARIIVRYTCFLYCLLQSLERLQKSVIEEDLPRSVIVHRLLDVFILLRSRIKALPITS